MKKTLLIMVMALAVLLTQCRKPEVKFPSPVSPEGTTVSMTVTAGPGSKTDITTAGGITWSSGDRLYVGFDGKYVGCLEIKNGQNTPTGWFSGNVTLPTDTKNGEKTFHFFYLGSNAQAGLTPGTSTQTTVSFATQTGLRENLGSCHIGYGTAQGTVAGSEVTGINVTLVSKVALARFSFKKAADGTPYTDALTLSGNNIYNSMTVNFNGTLTGTETGEGKINLTNTTVSEKYVMLVPAGATAATLNFGGAYEGTTTLGNGIEANKYYGQGGPIEVVLTKAPVSVTGVTLNKNSLSLAVGGTATLTATVAPDNATDKSVTWSSTDESVATVADGTVTAVAEGTATITVTATNGTEATDDDKTAECAVSVTAAPKPVEFTVDDNGTKVKFSPGNLYWDGSAFKFEANQWSFASSWVTTHVSHFFWSKDAAMAIEEEYIYASQSPALGDALFTEAVGFKVDGESGWRTLSCAEWEYLLNTSGALSGARTDANRFAKAVVNGVKGLLIFPDGYNGGMAIGTITGVAAVNSTDAEYPDESILPGTWSSMETAAVVFLPAAGSRAETVIHLDNYGEYWACTPSEDDEEGAYYMYFSQATVETDDTSRHWAKPLRVVRSAN